MNGRGVLVLIWITGTIVPCAAQAQNSKSAMAPAAEMRPNPSTHKLDPAITSQHERIQSLLATQTKNEVAGLVPEFRQQTRSLKPGTDLRALAAAQVHKQFPNLPPRETDVLAFDLLNETYATLPASSSTAGSTSDLSTEQQLQLQQFMDQKSKFEEALSNMLKSMSDTSDSIVQNIKG